MPMGTHKGKPVDTLATQYLAWLITQDHIRFKHPPLIREVLRVLRSRDLGEMLDELRVDSPPPDRRPTPEQVKELKAVRARKLAELEARRAAEREERREQRQAKRAQEQMRATADFIRARLAANRPAPDDVSDLI